MITSSPTTPAAPPLQVIRARGGVTVDTSTFLVGRPGVRQDIKPPPQSKPDKKDKK